MATGGAAPARAPEPGQLAQDTSLLDLPTELLVDILGRLPVAELVRARQVCRRVRAVVAILHDQDRPHYFRCGAADALSITQLRYTVVPECNEGYATPCTCGAMLWKRESVQQLVRMRSCAPAVFEEEEADDLENTNRAERERADSEIAARPYAARHDVAFPPARWALLAADRAIALEMAQQCARVDLRLIVPYGMLPDNGGPYGFIGWLPFVLRLPDNVRRPSTARGLRRLVDAVLDHSSVRLNGRYGGRPSGAETLAALFAKLESQEAADDFYSRARSHWIGEREGDDADEAALEERWRDTWQFRAAVDRRATAEPDPSMSDWDSQWAEGFYGDAELAAAVEGFGETYGKAAKDRDLSGWSCWQFRTRQLAANWRCSMAQGRPRAFRHFRLGGCGEWDQEPFAGMSNESVTAYLDGNVRAVDVAYTTAARLCPLSVVTEMEGPHHGHSWVVVAGLSERGHLVGALSGTSECKFW